MKLQFLGVGAAIKATSHGASLVVDDHILIDAPPSLNILLRRENLLIDTIFITHLHGDHFAGLPFWLLEKYVVDRERKVKIYGPLGLREKVQAFFRLVFSDVDTKMFDLLENIDFFVYKVGEVIPCGEYRITAVEGRHSVPSYGFIIEGEKSLYYSGDTELSGSVLRAISEADIVVIEGTGKEGTHAAHTTVAELLPIIRQHPDKDFYITHRQDYEVVDIAEPNLFFPEDGQIIHGRQ